MKIINEIFIIFYFILNCYYFVSCSSYYGEEAGDETNYFRSLNAKRKRQSTLDSEISIHHEPIRRRTNDFVIEQVPNPQICTLSQFSLNNKLNVTPRINEHLFLDHLGLFAPSISFIINEQTKLAEAVFSRNLSHDTIRKIIHEYNSLNVYDCSEISDPRTDEMFKLVEIRRRYPDIHFNFIPQIDY